MAVSGGWTAVDLDGTLAHYEDWIGPHHVGAPIPAMVARVKAWLAQGLDVRIFTARVYGLERSVTKFAPAGSSAITVEEIHPTFKAVEDWCLEHIGRVLPITCTKDYGMIQLWDDRAVQVEPNTGRRMDGLADERHLILS